MEPSSTPSSTSIPSLTSVPSTTTSSPSPATVETIGRLHFLNKAILALDRFPRYEDVPPACIIPKPTRIFAISHIWEMKKEPDPMFVQFQYCKELLLPLMQEDDGLFYDYSSIYQGALGEDGKRIFPDTVEGKALKKEFNNSLSQISNIFFGNVEIQEGNNAATKISVKTIVVSLHFHPQSMTRGWPYFELHKASQGACEIIGQAKIQPQAVLFGNLVRKLSSSFSLDDLLVLKRDFPVSLPGYKASLDDLIATRKNILQSQSLVLQAGLEGSKKRVTKDQLRFVKQAVELEPLAREVESLKASRSFFVSFFTENGDCEGVHHISALAYVFANINTKASVLEEVERGIVEKLVATVSKHAFCTTIYNKYITTLPTC